MKCTKCGYFSFDHLTSCKSCGRDLTDAQQALNLLDFQPEVPFLLGSLVGEMRSAESSVQEGLSLTQETELELAGLDPGESPGLEATVDMHGMSETLDSGPPEDLELSELALDDLETIEAAGTVEAEPAATIEDLAGLSGEEAELPEEADDGFMGLEFEMDDSEPDEMTSLDETLAAEEDFSDLELEAEIEDLPEAADLEEALAAEPASEPEEEVAAEASDMELDFSDDDLSALAEELDDHFEAEEGETAEDDLQPELEEVILEMEKDLE